MTANDDRPRDSLGRPARRLRYPVLLGIKVSEQAETDLDAMAEAKGIKRGKLLRKMIMRELYIWKAEVKRKEQA